MKLEVDQKSSSLRRRSDEAFLSCQTLMKLEVDQKSSSLSAAMRLFSRVQPLMKLEVDQKSSSLRRGSDEAFLSCAAADEAGSGSEKLSLAEAAVMRLFSVCRC